MLVTAIMLQPNTDAVTMPIHHNTCVNLLCVHCPDLLIITAVVMLPTYYRYPVALAFAKLWMTVCFALVGTYKLISIG